MRRFAEAWTLTYEPSLFSWDEEENNPGGYTNKVAENRRIAEQHILLNISRIQVEIPSDMNILDEEGVVMVENKTGFARTPYELKVVFDMFCSSLLGGWSKVKCMPVLQSAILDAMEQLFEIFETEAYKVVCSKQNQPKFADIISKALAFYKQHVLEKKLKADRGYVPYMWSVPEMRDYKDSTFHEREDVKNHAMMPFFELNNVSSPEKRFTDFLEENSDSIDWWYKNGDSGAESFAVLYNNSRNRQALFYVDYVIRMKSGKVFLFDTKTENSDSEAPNKHNALVEYMETNGVNDMPLQGGIIIENEHNWKYSPMKIENTTDLMGWDCFYPKNN